MSIGIIDVLEVIQVEHQQGHARALALRPPQLARQPLIEVSAVVKPGQAVALCLALGLLPGIGQRSLELHYALAGPDPRQQLIMIHRLDYVIVGAGLQGLHDVLLLRLGGHHDHVPVSRQVRGLQTPTQLQPVEVGHHPLGHHHLHFGGEQLQGLASVRCLDHPVLAPPEQVSYDLARDRVILDDHHGRLLGHCPAPSVRFSWRSVPKAANDDGPNGLTEDDSSASFSPQRNCHHAAWPGKVGVALPRTARRRDCRLPSGGARRWRCRRWR